MPSTRTTNIQKAATLARVRENQRRCRARKRERIFELERKVQDLEAGKSLSDESSYDKMRRLEEENQRLRALLQAAGLPQFWLDAFLVVGKDKKSTGDCFLPQQDASVISKRAGGTSAELAPRNSTPNLSSIGEATVENYQSTRPTPVDVDADLDFLNWTDMSFGLDSVPTVDNSVQQSVETLTSHAIPDNQVALASSVTTCCTGNNNCLNTSSLEGDATLCSVAFELIKRCNNKGLDMFEISVRLWSGFRGGSKGRDDCTVNNNVLFEVLNYIAG